MDGDFKPVPQELQELILYKMTKHLPFSIKAYNMTIYIQNGLFPERKLYYRVLDDCIDSSAFIMKNIYLGAIKEPFYASYAVIASQNNDLEDTLLTANLIEWHQPLLFNTVARFQIEVYQKVAALKGGCMYFASSPLWLYRLDDISKLKAVAPDTVKTIILDETYAEEIYEMWKLQFLLDLKHVKTILQHGKGIGVVLKETSELISWFIVNAYGSLGLLYTKAKYRNKGLARIAIVTLCKKLLDDDASLIMCVDIEDSNEKSKQLFKKLGFSEVFSYYVGRFIPSNISHRSEFASIISSGVMV